MSTDEALKKLLGWDDEEQDGLEGSEFYAVDEYLWKRAAKAATAVSKYAITPEANTYMLVMMYETLRVIALTLVNIENELERGHDNITRAIDSEAFR